MSRYANAVVLIIFGAVTFAGAVHHSPWRDEAYVWLMARDLSFGGLFRELKYNGSPGLWHSLLFVLAKSGLPYESQQYLHWEIACVAAGILLYKSPFSLLLRILILFSYFILYEHAIIVRVYLISIVLLYAVCIVYADKLQRPIFYGCLVGLLANANIFGLIAAALFAANFFVAIFRTRSFQRRYWIALFLALAGELVAVISVYPPSDGFSYYHQTGTQFAPANIIDGPICGFFGTTIKNAPLNSLMGIICLAILVVTLLLLWRRAAYFPLLLLVAMWLVIGYITTFQYPWSSPRHFSFYFIFTLTALWLANSSGSPSFVGLESALSYMLSGALVISAITSMEAFRDELVGQPFSGSKKLAAFIRDHQLAGRTFVGYPAARAAAVLPYFPGLKMWYPQLKSFGTYLHMVPRVRKPLLTPEIIALATNNLTNSADLLYLFDSKLKRRDPPLKLLGSFRGKRESFWLYIAPRLQVQPTSGTVYDKGN